MQLSLSSNWLKDLPSHWTCDSDNQQQKLIWKTLPGEQLLVVQLLKSETKDAA